MRKKTNVKNRAMSAALSALMVGSAATAMAPKAYAEETKESGYEQEYNQEDLYDLGLYFDEEDEEERKRREEEEERLRLLQEQQEEQQQEQQQEEVVEEEQEEQEEEEQEEEEENQEDLDENNNNVMLMGAMNLNQENLEEEQEEEEEEQEEQEQEEEQEEQEQEEEQEEEEQEEDEENDLVVAAGLVEAELDEELGAKLLKAVEEDAAKEEEEETEEDLTSNTKVAVITTKVDEEGKPLIGAVLQILDKDGNVIDQWISDGEEHISMLPEGDYILREFNAPDGYDKAADKPFNIKIDVPEGTAGVEHVQDSTVCWHYGGVPLYYVESEGERSEVYCVNQGWEEPNGQDYDGMVLDETNIRHFTPQADPDMSDADLYNKVLDIIYHRSKAEEEFPDLTQEEIRFITEYALKTYTSAEVTTRQAKRDENGHLIKDENGNYIYEDIKFLRYYSYDPNSPKGYVVDPENGNGIGKLAEHWYNQHGHSKIPAEYVEFFNYLVGNEETHPEDMSLFIYSTQAITDEGDVYQNLLGVRWFDPHSDEYSTYLTVVDTKTQTPPPPEPPKPPCRPPKYPGNCPKTGDESHMFENALLMLCSGTGLLTASYLLGKDIKKEKAKALTLTKK